MGMRKILGAALAVVAAIPLMGAAASDYAPEPDSPSRVFSPWVPGTTCWLNPYPGGGTVACSSIAMKLSNRNGVGLFPGGSQRDQFAYMPHGGGKILWPGQSVSDYGVTCTAGLVTVDCSNDTNGFTVGPITTTTY